MQEKPLKIGKFNSPEELLSAYNALEREFTKRCQLVSELQAELAAMSVQAECTPDPAQAQAPQDISDAELSSASAESVTAQTPQEDRAAAVTENAQEPPAPDPERVCVESAAVVVSPETIEAIAEEYAEELAAIPAVMDACLGRYKKKLIALTAAVPPQGMAVLMPQKKPHTLVDAKRIADKML